MNQLSTEQRVRVVSALVEGVSLRAISRMTGVHRTAIQKLLVELGEACTIFQDKIMRDLKCERLECDEIWQFVGAKQKNTNAEQKAAGWGDSWTFVAIDPVTKLVPSWLVGTRDAGSAYSFMHDLKSRVASRVQITTDGLKVYIAAVEDAFGSEVDYAMLTKIYGADHNNSPEARYSPGACCGVRVGVVSGQPVGEHICTSIVERQNLTMSTSMRRFTRLSLGFSKKLANHEAAIALHFMHYNFCKIHRTIRCTPAMEAGVSKHVWSIADLLRLIDDRTMVAA